MKALVNSLDRLLYKRGFQHTETRTLLRNQVLVSLGSSLILLAVTLASPFAVAYLVGSVLAVFNFWALCVVVQGVLGTTRGAVASVVFFFYGKLVITAGALYVFVAVAGGSVWGLALGLSTVVLNVMVWGMLRVISGRAEKGA